MVYEMYVRKAFIYANIIILQSECLFRCDRFTPVIILNYVPN